MYLISIFLLTGSSAFCEVCEGSSLQINKTMEGHRDCRFAHSKNEGILEIFHLLLFELIIIFFDRSCLCQNKTYSIRVSYR